METFELQYDLKPNGAVIRVNSEKGCVLRICQIPKELIFDKQGNVREYIDIVFPKVEKPSDEREYVTDIIKEKVIQIIVNKFWIYKTELTENTNFRDDLGADSMDMIELTIEFEKCFNINTEHFDVEKILTIGDAINALRDEINKKQ